MNKYVTGQKDQRYYPEFLNMLHKELHDSGYNLLYLLNSQNLVDHLDPKLVLLYSPSRYDSMSKDQLVAEAERIEHEYSFTLKQAWFPDILQTFKKQNNRQIIVPASDLNNLEPLIKKFLYLEDLISTGEYDFIFSDVSPEVEMEFARAIGVKHGIHVLKSYEGSFLGRSAILKLSKYGKYQFIDAETGPEYTESEAKRFIDDYVNKKQQPSYVGKRKNVELESIYRKIARVVKREKLKSILFPITYVGRFFWILALMFETKVLKKLIYEEFDPNVPYLFMGFHLNQESTMGLRSLPYVNQVALVEIISRVLPFGYTLYVREHPHWPERFPYSYMKQCTKYPNVRVISPNISIHDILKDAGGVIVYNSNTGIEALLYEKPVLSFSANIYYGLHPSVLHCTDLFDVGELLVKLINTKVSRDDTIEYVKRMLVSTLDMTLGSDTFLSTDDADEKAVRFARFLAKSMEVISQ